MMSRKMEELLSHAEEIDLFDELSDAEKEENRIKVEISNTIYSRRKELGLTQKQFAQMLEVSQPMISQWESGDYNFTFSLLVRVLSALHLKMNISFSMDNYTADQYVEVTSESGFIIDES